MELSTSVWRETRGAQEGSQDQLPGNSAESVDDSISMDPKSLLKLHVDSHFFFKFEAERLDYDP